MRRTTVIHFAWRSSWSKPTLESHQVLDKGITARRKKDQRIGSGKPIARLFATTFRRSSMKHNVIRHQFGPQGRYTSAWSRVKAAQLPNRNNNNSGGTQLNPAFDIAPWQEILKKNQQPFRRVGQGGGRKGVRTAAYLLPTFGDDATDKALLLLLSIAARWDQEDRVLLSSSSSATPAQPRQASSADDVYHPAAVRCSSFRVIGENGFGSSLLKFGSTAPALMKRRGEDSDVRDGRRWRHPTRDDGHDVALIVEAFSRHVTPSKLLAGSPRTVWSTLIAAASLEVPVPALEPTLLIAAGENLFAWTGPAERLMAARAIRQVCLLRESRRQSSNDSDLLDETQGSPQGSDRLASEGKVIRFPLGSTTVVELAPFLAEKYWHQLPEQFRSLQKATTKRHIATQGTARLPVSQTEDDVQEEGVLAAVEALYLAWWMSGGALPGGGTATPFAWHLPNPTTKAPYASAFGFLVHVLQMDRTWLQKALRPQLRALLRRKAQKSHGSVAQQSNKEGFREDLMDVHAACCVCTVLLSIGWEAVSRVVEAAGIVLEARLAQGARRDPTKEGHELPLRLLPPPVSGGNNRSSLSKGSTLQQQQQQLTAALGELAALSASKKMMKPPPQPLPSSSPALSRCCEALDWVGSLQQLVVEDVLATIIMENDADTDDNRTDATQPHQNRESSFHGDAMRQSQQQQSPEIIGFDALNTALEVYGAAMEEQCAKLGTCLEAAVPSEQEVEGEEEGEFRKAERAAAHRPLHDSVATEGTLLRTLLRRWKNSFDQLVQFVEEQLQKPSRKPLLLLADSLLQNPTGNTTLQPGTLPAETTTMGALSSSAATHRQPVQESDFVF